MNLPFLYSEERAEAFLDELLDTPDGWFRFLSQHRAWGFEDDESAGLIRDRSKGRYMPTVAHMVAMHDQQRDSRERNVSHESEGREAA